MFLDSEYNNLNNRAIRRKNREIVKILEALEIELTKIISHAKIKYPRDFPTRNIFLFNKNLKNKLDNVLFQYNKNMLSSIDDGIRAQWTLGNDKADDIISHISNYTANPSKEVLASMQGLNLTALDRFVTRKQNGLNLSQRVWDYSVEQNQELLETYLGSGITRGRSAAKISQDVRQLLNEPEKLFRRVRDKDGNLVLSQQAKAFHPGRGVYRSSFSNARRLAATELNMSFHNSDYLRRQNLPFVKGVLVRLSAAHPRPDICDAMVGPYPRGFIFEGFHPLCICYTQTLLASQKEVVSFLKTGEIDKRSRIRSIPRKAKAYIKEKTPALNRAKNKPYFLEKNFTKKFKLKREVVSRSMK